ncbi:hypothetical protein O3P69_020026 [Scylla paramamosain]|uniref:Abnormal spindle-like microcephaly-associated protein ASH domain-containing protein n=1 Tax=Scylla paramamosain TaxID=85552 RepID=A0AAW0TK15_SCYPA
MMPQRSAMMGVRRDGGHGIAYFEISPGQKQRQQAAAAEAAAAAAEVPVLRLIHFTHPPKLCFEGVKLGTTCLRHLRVLNPKDQTQRVICERFPKAESGFGWNEVELVLGPGQSVELEMWWTPTQEGGAREVVLWKTDIGVRSQTVLIGSCVDPRPKKKTRGRAPLRPKNVTAAAASHPKPVKINMPRPSSRGGSIQGNTGRSNTENRPPKAKTLPSAADKVAPRSRKPLGQVLQSTSSQESLSPPHWQTFSTPQGKILPPQPLSISSIASEDMSTSTSSSRSKCSSQAKKKPNSHVVWKDYVEEVVEVVEKQLVEVVEEQHVEVVEEHHVEYWEVTGAPPNQEVSPTLLRRQTFTQSTACRETFKGVRGGCLPPCEVEASPARRQTFVTAPSKETFQEVKEDALPTCPSPDTPLRRQTYLAHPPETFNPVVGGRLPACEVQESPLRRQTFIKNHSPPCVSQSHTPSPRPASVVVQPSTPSECSASHTLSQLLEGVSLENTPATPAPQPRHNPEAMIAYYRNLLERLNNSNFSFTPSNSPGSVGETGQEENGRDDVLTSPEEQMCTAPSTPLSEYESAPSTPPPVMKDNFNVTQEFPTPSIGGPVGCPVPAFIDSLEATLSPHSPASPSPRRLSSGTITKETSTLHPADLITVDSQPSHITPTRESTHPHLTSPDSPYQSEALSELLLYKGSTSPSCSTIGGEIFSPNRGDLTLESFCLLSQS